MSGVIATLALMAAVSLSACGQKGQGPKAGGVSKGEKATYTIVELLSESPYDQVVSRVEAAVKASNLMIIGEPNYQAMQRMVGRQIRGAKSFFVFRPDLGTRVFETDFNAAMEIPMKILIYDRGDGKTVIRYQKMSAAFANYKSGLEDLGKTLDEILQRIATSSVGDVRAPTQEITITQETIEKVVDHPYEHVVSRIEASVKASNLMIIGEPNYQAMQRMVGRQIRGAKSFFVFRPDLGTQVFENDYNAAMQIPLKILIYDRGDGRTVVRYQKPSVGLANYKGLEALGKTLDEILGNMVTAGTQA